MPIIGLSQERYHQSLTKFDKKLGLMVLKDTGEPISGIIFRGKKYIEHESTVIDGEVVSCVGYYKNGNIKHEGSYSNMMYNEFRKEYWRDGLLFSEGNFKDNFKDGLWTYYKSNGEEIKKQIIYEDGKVNKKRTRQLKRSSK